MLQGPSRRNAARQQERVCLRFYIICRPILRFKVGFCRRFVIIRWIELNLHHGDCPQSDFVAALVDRRPSLRLHRHQLHRPPDFFSARSLSQAAISLDEFRLRQHRHRLPRRLLDRPKRLRPTHGSHRHAARPYVHRDLVFRNFHAHLAGRRLLQLCHISFSAGSRRICQLARRHQGRVRVVSQTRARPGHGAVRQRFLDRRRGRSVYRAEEFTFAGDGGLPSWCRARSAFSG